MAIDNSSIKELIQALAYEAQFGGIDFALLRDETESRLEAGDTARAEVERLRAEMKKLRAMLILLDKQVVAMDRIFHEELSALDKDETP